MAERLDSFRYGDERISDTELFITVSSMIMGVGILSLPRLIAQSTSSSDGWISILIAGVSAIALAWTLGKLAARFPGISFFEYSAKIATKPVAAVIHVLVCIYFLLFLSYEVRAISSILREYMFDRTPVEVLALAFVLIVVYAVCGSRIGLIRLNLLFFPFVTAIVGVVMFMSLPTMHWEHLKPLFVTPLPGILSGSKECVFSLFGFEVVLFYAPMLMKPDKAPKSAAIGVFLPLLLYLAIYLIVIASFSNEVTASVIYPTVELAKGIEVPGEFFERFESLFFTIWMMTIFNSSFMTLDIASMALHALVPKGTKQMWAISVATVCYIISMIPEDAKEVATLSDSVSYVGVVAVGLIPVILYAIAIVRGVKNHG
ncbi:GerAB/ArcD/ProY family transporter [Paenibacillus flagellatus]|uniref:Spore gernimation protein n=1 Tax=Paenibacillus flagellatus TaxID=2211139 RepID=A0A2V5KCE8_9BACL|nr:endospore germination permease [Paenibacillus flagellatus]PYI57271.1 spore gernimation protein [Paenibacillus flagellatus]